MQEYEDVPRKMLLHMRRSAEQYMDGLQKAGRQPNERLTRAMAARALREARESYIQEATAIRDQNIKMILKKMKRNTRRRMRRRLLIRLLLASVCGAMTWYTFGSNYSTLGPFLLASFLFLIILSMLGAIFDY